MSDQLMSVTEFKQLVADGKFGADNTIVSAVKQPNGRLKVSFSNGIKPVYLLAQMHEGKLHFNRRSVQFFIDANAELDVAQLF